MIFAKTFATGMVKCAITFVAFSGFLESKARTFRVFEVFKTEFLLARRYAGSWSVGGGCASRFELVVS